MVPRSRQPHEPHVALEHDGLGLARNAGQAEPASQLALIHHPVADQMGVFAVVNNQRAAVARIGQGAAHHLGVGHGPGAVGEKHRAGIGQKADLGHLPALQSLGQGRSRQDAHNRGIARPPHHEINHRRIVDRRVGVRHAHDGRHAAGRGSTARRRQRLTVFGTGFADKGAHVD